MDRDRDRRRGRRREGRCEGRDREYKTSKVWELKPSTWEMEAGVLRVPGQPGLHSEVQSERLIIKEEHGYDRLDEPHWWSTPACAGAPCVSPSTGKSRERLPTITVS